MPDKCCVFHCQSNYDDGPKETVFSCPTRKRIMVLDTVGLDLWTEKSAKRSKKSCIYQKQHYCYKAETQGKRCRLVKKLKLVDTIFDQKESRLSAVPKDLMSLVSVLRKSWTKRVYQQDNFKLFEEQDKIKSFGDSDSTLTPLGYKIQKHDDHVVVYCLKANVLNIPEVTY